MNVFDIAALIAFAWACILVGLPVLFSLLHGKGYVIPLANAVFAVIALTCFVVSLVGWNGRWFK